MSQELSGEALPSVDIRTFYIGRVRDWTRSSAGSAPTAAARPSLHFLHTLLPHGPWLYFPDGRGAP